jgi:hypothetical protein
MILVPFARGVIFCGRQWELQEHRAGLFTHCFAAVSASKSYRQHEGGAYFVARSLWRSWD